jgi:hypothetical protein
MNKIILNTIFGVFLSSSLIYSADLIHEPDHSSIPTVTEVTGILPAGDTEPVTLVITLSTAPVAPDITREVMLNTARSFWDSLSNEKKFLSINFIDDKDEMHPETVANKLLRNALYDRKSKVSARQIFTYVIEQALKKVKNTQILGVLLNCGKSLRHVCSIHPPSVEHVRGKVVCDKPTMYHPDLLETSKALLETGLELARNYKRSFVTFFDFALTSTNSHLVETKKRVAEQISDAKEKERQEALLEEIREKQRLQESAVRERNERELRLQQALVESKELEKQRQVAIQKLRGAKKTPDGQKYRELTKKIQNKEKISDKEYKQAEAELNRLIREYM